MKTALWTIAAKEFKAYFLSPIAYIFLITFVVLSHWLFFRNFFLGGQAELRGFFSLMPWVYLFFVPAISMGKWSEERKTGTVELLFTLPLAKTAVVAGKFLAGVGLLATALIFTAPLLLTTILLGDADLGPIIGGYLGLLFLGGAYLAIGLWISSLTENQIIAFILGVTGCFVLLILGEPMVTGSFTPQLAVLFQYMSLGNHFDSIARGVLDTRDILYYLFVTFLFLFFNLKALEARAWK